MVKRSIVFFLSTLIAALLVAGPAGTAIQNYEFVVDISSGPLDRQSFSGSFSFDDSLVTAFGPESIELEDLSFVYQGVEFGKADASDPEGAQAVFANGVFWGLMYGVDSAESFLIIPGTEEMEEGIFSYIDDSGVGLGSVSYTPLREPTTAPVLLLWLL
jgi:hypothetical protein